MTNIDLKLLGVISELEKTRSVSQAAENLHSSQSAVSMSLARLRKHFNDPLFVRTSCGMEPTPHAVQIIKMMREAERLLETALGHHVVFTPETSTRVFTIACTDIFQHTILPMLLERLREVAPLVSIDLQSISADTATQLESGRVDLAFGFIANMGAGFFQQKLFEDRFVCAVRLDHPRVREALTLRNFEAERHIAISVAGSGHNVVEKTLESLNVRRRVTLTVPTFLGVGALLESSDCLAVIPEQLAQRFALSRAVRYLELPFGIPAFSVMQHWHERFRHDPANRWLRGLLVDLFCAPGMQQHFLAVAGD